MSNAAETRERNHDERCLDNHGFGLLHPAATVLVGAGLGSQFAVGLQLPSTYASTPLHNGLGVTKEPVDSGRQAPGPRERGGRGMSNALTAA